MTNQYHTGMNCCLDSDRETLLYKEQRAPFRETDESQSGNVAFTTMREAITDAYQRANTVGGIARGNFQPVYWGLIEGFTVNGFGFLRIDDGGNIEFSFLNGGRDDHDSKVKAFADGFISHFDQALYDIREATRKNAVYPYTRNMVVVSSGSCAVERMCYAISRDNKYRANNSNNKKSLN